MSRPSIENVFAPRNVRRRYCSRPSTRSSRISSRRFSSTWVGTQKRRDSIASRSQRRCSCDERCSISYATVPQ